MTLSQAAIDRAAEVLCDILRDVAHDLALEQEIEGSPPSSMTA